MEDKDLIVVQERLAYLENLIEKLGSEISTMFAEIRLIKDEIKILSKRQEENASAVCPEVEEVPPPHY